MERKELRFDPNYNLTDYDISRGLYKKQQIIWN